MRCPLKRTLASFCPGVYHFVRSKHHTVLIGEDAHMPADTILICDDEADILRYLKKMLERKGLAVETFGSGAPLLDRVKDGGEASLLLLDVRMPDMDGIAVLKQVK